MKHLKRFENFDFGRFNYEDDENKSANSDFDQNDFDQNEEIEEIDDQNDIDELGEKQDHYGQEDIEEEEEETNRIKRWGDEEIVEKKKINPGFQAYLDKQKEKNAKKDDKKSDKKDDKKEDKKDTKAKGLTAKQRKLPEAMQKAILKKQGK